MIDWKRVAGDRNRLSPKGVVERVEPGEDEQGLIRSMGSNQSVLEWSPFPSVLTVR